MKIPNKSNRLVLYKIVEKALKDNFHIQNFLITEIFWLKFDDCIVYFRSKGEAICFYVRKNGGVIPQKIAVENENEYLCPQKTCQEAVWDDF